MSTLIIYLPLEAAVADTEFEYAITPDGVVISEQGRATADALPAVPGADRVAVAPARALSWHSVTLPEGLNAGSSRLRAVLDGLLEDQLLDEPGRMHFALPPTLFTGEPQWIAACDRRWLAMAYQRLEAADRQVSRVVPEWGPPGHSLRLHVSGAADDPQLLVCSESGVSQMPLAGVSLAALATLTPPASGSAPVQGLEPEAVTAAALSVSAEPPLVDLTSHALGCPVLPLTREERWLRAISSTWDLAKRLQMRKRANRARLEWLRAPRWRPARWAAMAVLGLNLAGLNALAWVDRQQLNAKQDWMAQTLRRNFPQVPAVVDAPAQMARQVQLLAEASAQPQVADMDVMLGVLSQNLPPGQNLQAIEFNNGQLRLRGLTLSAAQLTTLSSQLQTRGYALSSEPAGALMRALPGSVTASNAGNRRAAKP
jgi:general secretion pathway protein L